MHHQREVEREAAARLIENDSMPAGFVFASKRIERILYLYGEKKNM